MSVCVGVGVGVKLGSQALKLTLRLAMVLNALWTVSELQAVLVPRSALDLLSAVPARLQVAAVYHPLCYG